MAQYQHLPIYKVTYELLLQITKVTKEFPRDYKHSLAAKLRDEAVDLVVYIYKANSLRAERARLARTLKTAGYSTDRKLERLILQRTP